MAAKRSRAAEAMIPRNAHGQSLYSMGAFFSDQHPDLRGRGDHQSEAIEEAGLAAYAEVRHATLEARRDAPHRAGGACCNAVAA